MTTDLAADLRAAGLRVTRGRLEVLELLENAPHSDAESIRTRLRAVDPDVSIQSVHNVLSALASAGLVRRIEPAKSAALYERRIGDNHHHVVCTGCGAIEDIDCVVGHAPCLTPSSTSGFRIETAEVTFWGLCAACAAPPPIAA
ncbi:Fur family transcriptional regulator [Labedella endophytica]|uniref:Transcriptional repressor n=1 Tax=Labedella endophytica TaxID=1523160 RepID=A0A3S0X8B1_9MICO|nr:Fur family transcriptional regulator [Labedella endophytica]RUR01745.1 transcriptional repressor [Labedella endophytica]